MLLEMRKAFTMIELVFTIVIIGILASVAIPKLAASRTDAESSVCASEASDFLLGAVTFYTSRGFYSFKNFKAGTFTNVPATNSPILGLNSFSNTKVDTDGVDFYCSGEKIMNFLGNSILTGDYNLTVTLELEASVSSPAAKSSILKIKSYLLNGEYSKSYSL